jgi:hypothetical protein
MFSVDVPRGVDGVPLLPETVWAALDPRIFGDTIEGIEAQVRRRSSMLV